MAADSGNEDAAQVVLLHPVRMRIVVALAGRELTPAQLRAELTDVPQATLYQHLGRLTRAGVLKVVAERPARGATERVYAINTEALALRPAQPPKEMSRFYATFIAALLADGSRYLRGEDIDAARDGFGFRQVVLYAAPEEMREVSQALSNALMPYLTRGEAPGRRRIHFSTVSVPQEHMPEGETSAPGTDPTTPQSKHDNGETS